jgi:hypothetical protein
MDHGKVDAVNASSAGAREHTKEEGNTNLDAQQDDTQYSIL